MVNSRRHPRAPLNSDSTLKGSRFWSTCEVRNISEGGVCLIRIPPESVGSEVEVEFQIPNKNFPVMAKGVIIWNNQSEESRGGLEFTRLFKLDRELIREFIKEHPASACF